MVNFPELQPGLLLNMSDGGVSTSSLGKHLLHLIDLTVRNTFQIPKFSFLDFMLSLKAFSPGGGFGFLCPLHPLQETFI